MKPAAVHGSPRSFRRSFAADLGAPAAARHAVQSLNGLVADDLVERGRLVVTELVTNSVMHAGLTPEQHVDLRIAATRELLWMEVFDDGDGFDPAAIRAPHGSAGGWGLWMVAQLTDRWGVDLSHSTRVWCQLISAPQRTVTSS
jgi:anti-sigma regulatory factor (Ser/Thr protein kinase)